jgi:clan AA aspartic protease
MITGLVNANLEAQIGLVIEHGSGQMHAFEAAVDTGFTGWMCLPPVLVASLGLVWLQHRDIQLIDGSVVSIEVFSAKVIWDSQPRIVDVYALDSDPLVGMKMLAGHELRFQEIEAMARNSKKGPVFHVKEAVENIGLQNVINELGEKRLIDQIGKKEVIKQIGEDDVVDSVFHFMNESERADLKRRIHEAKKKKSKSV